MRLIDADDLYRKVVGYNGGAVDKTVAKRLIEQQPTVQRNSTQSNASNTLNALNALDTIYRQAAIEAFEPWLKVKEYSEDELYTLKAVLCELRSLPSAQPDSSACWGCNCPKMEQKTFSEMVRLHDAERRADGVDC